MKPHKHADTIKAWADGAQIQYFEDGKWCDFSGFSPAFGHLDWRIKPEARPDVTMVMFASPFIAKSDWIHFGNNLRLTFDGETMKLKAAEVLK